MLALARQIISWYLIVFCPHDSNIGSWQAKLKKYNNKNFIVK